MYLNISVSITERTEIFKLYMADVRRFKTLDETAINDLTERAAKGDERAINKLVNCNLRFVVSVAKRYQGLGLDLMDLINEGNIGLYKAVTTYDPSKGAKFLPFAVHWIRAYITNAITDKSRVVRLPSNHKRDDFLSISGDATIGSEDDDYTLFGNMASETKTDKSDDTDYLATKFATMLNRLNEKEKQVICLLFGIGSREHTQNEVALMFGLTEERVRQIKCEAIEKMRKMK